MNCGYFTLLQRFGLVRKLDRREDLFFLPLISAAMPIAENGSGEGKSSPCDSSYQRIHLCDTTLSVSTRHFENNFGQSACFQHFARTISNARLSEQPIGRHAVSLTGCGAIQKGRIGRRVEMIAFILSCNLHCQRPAAFLYPELSKTLQGRVKNQLAISALTYAHYSILKAHRGDDCDFRTAKAATPRRGVAAF